MQCLRRLHRVLQPCGSLGGSTHADSSGLMLCGPTLTATRPAAALAAILERMGLAERLPAQRSMHSSSSSSSSSSSRPVPSTGPSSMRLASRAHSHRTQRPAALRPSAPALLQQQWHPLPQMATLLLASRAYASRHTRGVKARRRRLNNRASWAAVQPFLDSDAQGAAGVRAPKGPRPPAITSAIPSLPVVPEPTHVQRIGSITQQYALQQQQAFAVVQLGPFQYKVTADDLVFHPRLYAQGSAAQCSARSSGSAPKGSASGKPRPQDLAWRQVEVNEVLKLGKVLLYGDAERTFVGRPYLPGAHVIAVVEEQFKDAKVQVFKKQKRKRQSKRHGHRSFLTTLRILEVQAGEEVLRMLEEPDRAVQEEKEGQRQLQQRRQEQQQRQLKQQDAADHGVAAQSAAVAAAAAAAAAPPQAATAAAATH